jgi:uncharacterized protein with NRDE domain
MGGLRSSGPWVLGGRDELAGGTWLAVNEHGVVAGLTNRPAMGGRDPSKRSRGELPLALAQHRTARGAVEQVAGLRPWEYNGAWLMVADRYEAFFVDMSGGTSGTMATVRSLGAGVHVLENRALGEPSPKLEHVRSLLAGAEVLHGDALVDRLRSVLVDHAVPASSGDWRPAGVEAACVHLGAYGTRTSTVIRVSASEAVLPAVMFSDGPSCTAQFVDATRMWKAESPQERSVKRMPRARRPVR